MQRRATLWITGAFQTAPSLGVEAITDLVPIHLYIKKLYGRFLLCQSSLPSNHIIHSILSSDGLHEHSSHNASIDYLIAKQRSRLKSSLINVHDKRNEFFPSFSFFNHEFKSGNHIIDIFPDCLSFHSCTLNAKKNICNLEEIIIKVSIDPFTTIVISDASIKNQVATSVSHIHSYDKPVVKTLHSIVNITTAKAELFAMRYGINQAVTNHNIKHIVIISDSLHVARKIFNSSTHPYQIHSATVSLKLREFFSKDFQNYIKFWDCPSKLQWALHHVVNQDTKFMTSVPSFPYKSLWDFCKKSECDSITSLWRMTFQASDSKGRNFLGLLNDDLHPIEPSCTKGGLWLLHFSYSNLLYTRASRAITNHAPIGEYRLRFFPKESFTCPCGIYSIETRQHILHECHRFNNY